MSSTVTLSASAKYGYGGKQFVARINGRDSKFTFDREFVGKKSGKRGDYTEAMVDDPGLYEERDIDSKGRSTDTYYLIWQEAEGDFRKTVIPKEDAMVMAKWLDEGKSVDWRRESLDYRIDKQKELIAAAEAKNDPDGEITLEGAIGSLAKGATVKRSRLIEERRRLIAGWERELNPPEDAAVVAREQAVAQIREMMRAHNISTDELS
jgi:hypothetical protein